jgi:apolipoprotein N-acyltransferase
VYRVIKSDQARRLALQAAVLLAGAISALGFAPLNLWPLPILAFAFLTDRGFRAAGVRQAFATGWSFGVSHFLVSLNWVAESFTHQEAMPVWVGWLGVVLVSSYFAVYPGLACALAWRLSGRHPLGWVLLLAASWMLCEWARAGILGGFAWNPLAVIWLALPPLAQCEKWVGPYGMSGLVLLAAGGLWLGLQHRWRSTTGIAVGLLLLGVLLRSRGGVPSISAGAVRTGTIPVHIVQPNISEDEKHAAGMTDATLKRYAALSLDAHASPRLLLWPEGALQRFLDPEGALHWPGVFISPLELTRLMQPGDVLLSGAPSITLGASEDDDVLHNSVFGVDSAGHLLWRYDKAHLVPFGEFLPARPVLSRLGLSRLVPGNGADFSPGPGTHTFEVPGFIVDGRPLTVAVQICYEIIFPGRVVDEAHRPSFVFNPSNDAWFGAWGPPQHLAQAQLRAIEEGLPIIRATPNGISAVIGPEGQVLSSIPHGRAGVIDAYLPAALPPTLFSRLGLWTSGIVGLLLGTVGLAVSRGAPVLPRPQGAVLEQPPA